MRSSTLLSLLLLTIFMKGCVISYSSHWVIEGHTLSVIDPLCLRKSLDSIPNLDSFNLPMTNTFIKSEWDSEKSITFYKEHKSPVFEGKSNRVFIGVGTNSQDVIRFGLLITNKIENSEGQPDKLLSQKILEDLEPLRANLQKIFFNIEKDCNISLDHKTIKTSCSSLLCEK